jgi:hypothetical protein
MVRKTAVSFSNSWRNKTDSRNSPLTGGCVMRGLIRVCGVVVISFISAAQAAPSAETCAAAATVFLASLTTEQHANAVRPFEHEGRKKWTNLPGSRFREEGLPFGEMTEEQRKLGHRLVQCGLSSQGYQKATGIMRLDDYLFSQLADPARLPEGFNFGHGYYWLGVFGDPASDAPWGWQLDGHHLGLNFTVVGGKLEVTPAFIGAQPNEVPSGPYAGWRILGEEEDKALNLIQNLDDRQRRMAVLSDTVPDDIFTGPERGDALREFAGLPASDMTSEQHVLLDDLIAEYVNNMEPDAANPLWARITADGRSKLFFAWMGGTTQGSAFYYRIHSPSVLIEFDHTLNLATLRDDVHKPDPNHIHTVLRQPGQDYGEDMLRRHHFENHSPDEP